MATLLNTDIQSTTLEAGLLEIVQLLQTAEQAFEPDPGIAKPNRVQLTINTDAKTASISVTLPLNLVVSDTGAIIAAAEPYC
ncbi:hypothetical protein AB3R30_21680 [Leptolyngbyaceae cyanobacterium UHCC 1019]